MEHARRQRGGKVTQAVMRLAATSVHAGITVTGGEGPLAAPADGYPGGYPGGHLFHIRIQGRAPKASFFVEVLFRVC